MAAPSLLEVYDKQFDGRVSATLKRLRAEGKTQAEIADALVDHYGIGVDRSTISRWLGRVS